MFNYDLFIITTGSRREPWVAFVAQKRTDSSGEQGDGVSWFFLGLLQWSVLVSILQKHQCHAAKGEGSAAPQKTVLPRVSTGNRLNDSISTSLFLLSRSESFIMSDRN